MLAALAVSVMYLVVELVRVNVPVLVTVEVVVDGGP